MNKDIIYIDTEDDITAIIGKIKSSADKIVALVPPKRVGVLQSAVNLRLLARMAKTSQKHLVIITNNKALIALSASAKIPVAKNLQSKPEIAEIAALEIDDGEDIIEGAKLPVGDFVKITNSTLDEKDVSDVISTIDIDNDGPESIDLKPSSDFNNQPVKNSNKNGVKVPDFSKFRKKLFLGIAAGILFIIFLIWAIWFAPAATIIITTKTEPAPVSMTLKLGGSEPTDVDKGIVQTITKQIKKDVSVEFVATGKDTIGEKASGAIVISNASKSSSIYVPSGTVFSNGDFDFTTTASVTVPGATVDGGIVPGIRNANVVAIDVGADYNLAPATYKSSISGLTASGGQMSGGSSHEAIVVTQEDIQKAGQALVDLPNNDVKQQLIKQFTNGEKVINDSFDVIRADAVSAPEIGAEAIGGKAKLTSSSTFTINAIAKSELQSFLKNSINKQLSDGDNQRIYDDGFSKVSFSGYSKNEDGATVNIATTGKVGPKISEESIKEQVKSKQYGDVQLLLEKVKGVSNVDIKFSYFWVNTVPGDVKKIDVEFILKDV